MRAFRPIGDSPDTSPEPELRAEVWDSLVSDLETDCIAVDVSDSTLMNEDNNNVSGSSDTSDGYADGSSSTGGSPVIDMMGDMVWPVSLNDWVTMRGEKPSKEFFLAAVQVALSLAVKLESQCKGGTVDSSVLCGDIAYSNVAVSDEHGDSDFVTKSGVSPSGKTSGLGMSDVKTNRKEIFCLGKVFFRLFTRGSALPMNELIKKPSNLESSFMNLTSETYGGFRLNIDDATSYESSLHERFHDSYRKSPFAAKMTGAEKGILGLANKQRKGEDNSPLTLMQIAGVPSSVCRLVNDMLMNQDDEGVDSLFRHDQAITSFRDVVQDLEQMTSDPDLFLHDSLALKFKPVMCDKIYGRDEDLKLVFDVTNKVSSQSDAQCQDVVMISGHSGCGKSRLVNELITHVHKKRWLIVHCKFDALSAGVSAVLSAFDKFFQEINEEGNSDEELEGMRSQVMKHFDANNLNFLCGIIPNFLGFVKDETNLIHADSSERNTFNSGEVQAATSCLNLLLNLMIKLLSSAQRPLLLFLDDLHWGDETAMALLNSLVDDLSQEAGLSNDLKRVLIVGSYRDNEVDEKHPLHATIEQIKTCEHVEMTEVCLNGLSSTDVELMVSDSLVYPRRLTRSLSKLIHQKSIGNPLFVREFLHELSAENLLTYSLANKKWEWNEDTIQDKTVSNSVAELLTRRLSRLPDSVLQALRIMSCFGSNMDCQVLTYSKDMCETTGVPQDQSNTDANNDIFTELDFARKEGLIERNEDSYKFSHDMVYEAVEQGFRGEHRINMLRELTKALLRSMKGEEFDKFVFVVASLINRIGSSRTSDPNDRTRYAEVNLSAGNKAIQSADFASALVYIQSGVSFQNSNCWQTDYSLTLSLYEKNSVANWALGYIDAMKSSIETIIKHARCFDDKISSIYLLVHSLGLDGKSVTKATSHGFTVLEYLGETFSPSMSNPAYIAKELSDLKSQLKEFIPTPVSAPLQIDNFSMMTDHTKLKCMSFLWELSILFYSQKSPLFHVVNARMIKLTIEHGLCTFSSVAFAMTGLSFAFVLKDVSEGYRLGKIALSLVSYNASFKYLLPDVYAVVYGALSVWKEPIQVLLPPLLEAYQVCIRSGKMCTAGATCMLYVYRALFSGAQLANLHTDLIGFTRVMFARKRTQILLALQPIMQGVMCLRGIPSQTGKDWSDGAGYDSIRGHLAQLVAKSEMALCESIMSIILMTSFIFHRGEDAEEIVKEYLELFQRNDETYPEHFVSVYRCFYGSLISFHYYRKTKDDYWLGKGTYSMAKIEAWNCNSAWNFQNKVCLLQAEYYFSLGRISRAQQLYKMAIELSNKHRFTHEEAVACELSRSFHMTMKAGTNSDDLMKRAYKCYQQWGADAKANGIAHTSSASLFDN